MGYKESGGSGMSDTECTVITVREILRADVLKAKGIAVTFLGADDDEYILQLPIAEAQGLAGVIKVALAREKPQHT